MLAVVPPGKFFMDAMFPCVLSYCLDLEIETELTLTSVEALEFALDRFRADEVRLGVGLMARVKTLNAGTLFIGSCSQKAAACLGYALPSVDEALKLDFPKTRFVAGGENSAGAAEFHFFYPDCPSFVSEYETLPWPIVKDLATGFVATGRWPKGVLWFGED